MSDSFCNRFGNSAVSVALAPNAVNSDKVGIDIVEVNFLIPDTRVKNHIGIVLFFHFLPLEKRLKLLCYAVCHKAEAEVGRMHSVNRAFVLKLAEKFKTVYEINVAIS